MTLCDELIQAVKSGGINNWPTIKHSHVGRRSHKTAQTLDILFNSIHGVMTTAEISKASGICQDTTYKYLMRLMDDGRVIREGGQPFVYRRA